MKSLSRRIVIPRPTRSGFGGVSRVIQSVTKNIPEFEFEIICPPPDDDFKQKFSDNVSFRTFSKRLPGWGIDYRRPAIRNMLSEDRYDLIWNNTLMLNDLAAKADNPVLTTFHSVEKAAPRGLPTGLRKAKNRVESKIQNKGIDYLADCDRVVCVSDRSRNFVEGRTSANAVRIYNGADTLGSEFSEEDENYIFCADGDGRKEAVYVAGKIDFPVKVLRGGEKLKEKAEAHDIDLEIIERTVSEEELRDLYRKCSFYVYCAYSDGFGLTPKEANHFGKPAVVFETEVSTETMVNGETGFRAANMYEMVERSQELAEDEEMRRNMGEKALKHARENFTWEKAAKRYKEEFLSVMEL